jgi:hypothetical protein
MITLSIHNEYDPVLWDGQASKLGGEFFHAHAPTIYRSRLVCGLPLFVEAIDSTGCCVGIATGVLSIPRYWPFSCYGRVASFAATPTARGDLHLETRILELMEQRLKAAGVFHIELDAYHSPNSPSLLPTNGYDIAVRHEYAFDLALDLDDLFAAFSSTKRNNFRRAEKRGMVTREENSFEAVELVECFRNLALERRAISGTKVAANISEARRELFASKCTRILVSYLDDKPVGACIFGVFNNRVYALRSGSSNEGNENFSPVHLYWSAIRLFKSEGNISLCLGGAKETETGLRQFKQLLGAVESYQPCGSKVFPGLGEKLDAIRKMLK